MKTKKKKKKNPSGTSAGGPRAASAPGRPSLAGARPGASGKGPVARPGDRVIAAEFTAGAKAPDQFPPPALVEIAFAGRSNVGKSSLLNRLMERRSLVRTSSTPGCTRQVSWFEVECDDKARFALVDLPGYGYAKVHQAMRESWKPLIEAYLSQRATLAGVLLLIDIRRGPEDEELDFVPWLAERETPMLVALTKADKLPKNKRMLEIARARKTLGLTRDPYAVSTLDHEGIDRLWRAMLTLVPR